MENTIIIPVDLLERIRKLPGAASMEDGRLVSLCLMAGIMAAEQEEKTPEIRRTIEEINRLLKRCNLRQLSLIIRMVQAIV